MSRGLVVFVSLLLGASVLAQKKPDFSGIWAPGAIKTKTAVAEGGSAGLPPSDLTIQHTAAALAVSSTYFDIVNTQTYKLDASESTNKSGAVTYVTRSRWDGPRLVIEGKASQVTSAGYAAWTLKETYSLNARGQLILEAEHRSTDGTVTTSTQEFSRKKNTKSK